MSAVILRQEAVSANPLRCRARRTPRDNRRQIHRGIGNSRHRFALLRFAAVRSLLIGDLQARAYQLSKGRRSRRCSQLRRSTVETTVPADPASDRALRNGKADRDGRRSSDPARRVQIGSSQRTHKAVQRHPKAIVPFCRHLRKTLHRPPRTPKSRVVALPCRRV